MRIFVHASQILLVSLFFICISCKQERKNNITLSKNEAISTDVEIQANSARSIFYSMLLPSEMSKVFERMGADYNQGILNLAENEKKYSLSSQVALNLGIYGVDLGYTQIYDDLDKVNSYLKIIKGMAGKLGIPEYLVSTGSFVAEKNIKNKDSLYVLSRNLYLASDKYLKENERSNVAALIMLGGWVEAMYLASSSIREKTNNNEIIRCIAEQKYSLNSLMALLSTFNNDPLISKYFLLLKVLKKSYDKIDIYYNQGDIVIDTTKKVISASSYRFDISPKEISEIRRLVKDIRTEMIQ
jgi:hypothetical protein